MSFGGRRQSSKFLATNNSGTEETADKQLEKI